MQAHKQYEASNLQGNLNKLRIHAPTLEKDFQ